MKSLSLPFLLCLFLASHASAQGIEVGALFKSVEHKWLGDNATLPYLGTDAKAAAVPLHLANENALTYGAIIALAADYYGLADQPISDGETLNNRIARFLMAYKTLSEEDPYACAWDYCANQTLRDIEAGSWAKIAQLYQDDSFDGLYQDRPVTSGYFQLALHNWDHFLPNSLKAYEAGHLAAIRQAINARSYGTDAERKAALETAYSMNAFADHFLTDMFASGHLRVPRKELYDQSSTTATAGLLTKQMHDEDGRVGLLVHNRLGETWRMYGDGELFRQGAEKNREQVQRALQISIAEVALAFATGQPRALENFGILNIMAVVDDALSHPNSPTQNSSPLYRLDEAGRVVAREPLNSRCSYEWVSDWWGVSRLWNYDSRGDGSNCIYNTPVSTTSSTDALVQ